MSWHGGSSIMGSIIETCLAHVPHENIRRKMYAKIIPSLEDQDWDDLSGLFGHDPAYDKAVRDLHPYDYKPLGSPHDKFEDFDDDDDL